MFPRGRIDWLILKVILSVKARVEAGALVPGVETGACDEVGAHGYDVRWDNLAAGAGSPLVARLVAGHVLAGAGQLPDVGPGDAVGGIAPVEARLDLDVDVEADVDTGLDRRPIADARVIEAGLDRQLISAARVVEGADVEVDVDVEDEAELGGQVG